MAVNYEDLRHSLLKMSDDYSVGIEERAATKLRLGSVESEMKRLEVNIRSLVASRVDEKGKKVFPNEDSRNAEVARRLERNEDYRRLLEEYRGLVEKLAILEARITSLEVKIRCYRTILESRESSEDILRRELLKLISKGVVG